MNRDTINLSCLYNPPKYGLDNIHDDILKGWEEQEKFERSRKNIVKYFNACNLEDAIYILIKAYKNRYASSAIGRLHNYATKSIEGINPREDLTIDWHYERDWIDLITVSFTESIDIALLNSAIEDVLSDKDFNVLNNVYKVLDSPIDEISLSLDKLEIRIHSSKVIRY